MVSKTFIFSFLPSLVLAVTNDWSKPCTFGTCAYTSGDGKASAWSTFQINAISTNSLSDITTAAGWEILNCDSNSVNPQDIRLVCMERDKGCDQLFEGGAEDTIVRLPESCAGGPFARVVRTWVDEDQTLPPRLAKRQIPDGRVRGLALDFDFAKIPQSKGEVYFTVSATNNELQRNALREANAKRSIQPLRHASRRGQTDALVRDFASRSLTTTAHKHERRFFKKIGKFFKDTAKKVGDAFQDVGKAIGNKFNKFVGNVKDVVEDVVDDFSEGIGKVVNEAGDILEDAGDAIGDFVDAVTDLTDFDENLQASFDLIDIDDNFSIINESIDCPASGPGEIGFAAGIDINVDVQAKLTANVGFIIAGSIIPPNIDNLAFTGGLDGGVDAQFNVKANAKGTFSTGDIRIFEIGIPGLSFPGILTVGPSASINVRADAELSVVADLTVNASYDLPKLEFVFPPDKGESQADVQPKREQNPLDLRVGANAQLNGALSAHLVPRLDIGIDVLGGIAKATVFLNVDGAATLNFELKAAVESEGNLADGAGVDTKFGGSIGLDLGVSINAGAEAGLLGFFDADTSVELLEASFTVFEKQFGDQFKRRSLPTIQRRQNGLICPAPGEVVGNENIAAQ